MKYVLAAYLIAVFIFAALAIQTIYSYKSKQIALKKLKSAHGRKTMAK